MRSRKAAATVVALAVATTSSIAIALAPGPAPTSPYRHGLYWGAWIDKHVDGTEPPWRMSALHTVERRLGKRMSLVAFGTPLTDRAGRNAYVFPRAQLEAVRAHGSIPFVSWSTHAAANPRHRAFTLRALLRGSKDRQIRAWAVAAGRWGKPLFVRFDWEMNGSWFPWSESNPANRRGEFVALWRRVHRIFDRAGARNVTWVWCPAADPDRRLARLRGLYPGDAYVDWTCIDAYNGASPWRSPQAVLATTYDEIMRIAPRKPMVLAEIASTEIGGDKAAWIDELFASLPRRFARVRALIWFDQVKSGPGGRRDWPLDSSPAAQDAFARGISDAAFRGSGYGKLRTRRIPLP